MLKKFEFKIYNKTWSNNLARFVNCQYVRQVVEWTKLFELPRWSSWNGDDIVREFPWRQISNVNVIALDVKLGG